MADDKGNNDHPPMATLNKMTSPGGGTSSPKFNGLAFLVVIIVAALLILAVKPKQLDVYKTIDALQFADAELARCVKAAAAANHWSDVGHAGKLRCNNPSGDGIRSLEGVEHLVELTEANFAFNNISDIGPLASLARLETVDLSHNNLSQLPVFRSAPNLKNIELNYNQIESLDWLTAEHFLVLESLSIAHNHIADISKIPTLDGIIELSIRDNRVSDITPILQLRNLVMLDAGNNQIGNLSGIGALGELRRLFLDGNNIDELDQIDSLPNLEELDLAYNALASTAPVSGLERLQRVNLNHTGIKHLSGVLSIGDLQLLRISGNPDLDCDDIAAAIGEYGETAIRSDKECNFNGDAAQK